MMIPITMTTNKLQAMTQIISMKKRILKFQKFHSTKVHSKTLITHFHLLMTPKMTSIRMMNMRNKAAV